jgi:hypothetical protein
LGFAVQFLRKWLFRMGRDRVVPDVNDSGRIFAGRRRSEPL